MEPKKQLKTFTGEGLPKLPNGQPIPANLPPEQANLSISKKKQQEKVSHRKIYRKSGEEQWLDPSLDEWDENDYRVFIGNLAKDVDEDTIRKAFSKFSSIQKIKIVRDKRTLKTKGFGFISFLSADEYLQAFQEMNGRYVGSQPITMKKSDWKKKSLYKNS